eukprot:TRINITY_DN4477_c0_g1_i1.p1 TRINITY_DN4477_c0_g1~~TRINITY_DN4477_c0_g1_i1.p1  ORF type:complete len:796 (+),score=308.29 TRINITY_DN4477_c0_g1_i1:65-2452(+)
MKPGVLLFFCLLAVLPSLLVIANGETNVADQDVPTPDTVLRSNERIGSKTDDEVIAREEERMSAEGFSIKEQRQLEESAKKHTFQAEVNKLMKIIINSLYSNREVFLRELISNASDALDKIRFMGLTNHKLLETNPKLEIKIKADRESNTLHIVDSGIGMTAEELTTNLGTIAKSGTTEFLNQASAGGADTSNLIGQFGVGFYSAFLVADQVTVISKSNNGVQSVWKSSAAGEFTVSEDPRGDTLGRGTEIILHLKEDADEYLDDKTLSALVKRYSEFINFPIYLWSSHEEEIDVPLTEEELAAEKKDDTESETVDLDEDTPKEEKPIKTKTKKVDAWDWELMNETKPIWTRNPKDISDDEYNNFYAAFSKDDTNEPICHIHFNAEGEVDFKSLLFIPSVAPKNMFDPSHAEAHKGLKLFVRRVFITDEFKDLLPKYLNFIKGIVDSDDLPLNVSREMLQEHKILKIIKKKLIRKAISMFQTMADEEPEKFAKFWTLFGTNMKLGVIDDPTNRTRLAKLLMFHSSKTGENTSLEKYVERMKKGQDQIYYLAGESLDQVSKSPLIEKLIKKDYEVLFMVEAIDEYTLANLGEKYDGKYKLTNVARENIKLTEEDEEAQKEKDKEVEKQMEPLLKYLRKTLGGKIEKAVISKRLTNSPSALVSTTFGWTPNMERVVKAQALSDATKANKEFFSPKKVLEVNPRHPIVKELAKLVESEEDSETASDMSWLMYETAALHSGWSLDNTEEFARRIVKIMNLGLKLDANASVEEEPESAPVEPEIKEEEDTIELQDKKEEL